MLWGLLKSTLTECPRSNTSSCTFHHLVDLRSCYCLHSGLDLQPHTLFRMKVCVPQQNFYVHTSETGTSLHRIYKRQHLNPLELLVTSHTRISNMSEEENKAQAAIDQYFLRHPEAIESPELYITARLAQDAYEKARYARVCCGEKTVEKRKSELQDLFKSVDAGEQPLKREPKQVGELGEVTNTIKALQIRKQHKTVIETEIAPLQPCKSYSRMRRNLPTSGRENGVGLLHPMEEDQLVEELLDKAQLAEEQLFQEQFAKEGPEIKKNTSPKGQKGRKGRKHEKESENRAQEARRGLPSCAMG